MLGLAFLPNIGTTELIVLLVIGLLLFGRRLPEVGRSLGKGIVEFKKGLKGIEDEVDTAVDRRGTPSRAATLPPTDAIPAPGSSSPASKGRMSASAVLMP